MLIFYIQLSLSLIILPSILICAWLNNLQLNFCPQKSTVLVSLNAILIVLLQFPLKMIRRKNHKKDGEIVGENPHCKQITVINF